MITRRRVGFTLIELLTVVGIIAILAAFLFPVFASAREAARRTNCLSNLRQLALAHQMYVQDHDDVLPFWYYRGEQDWVMWPEFLRRYFRDPRIVDQGWTTEAERRDTSWLADYVLCAWGSGGRGTAADPYWRWPGALSNDPVSPRPMALAEVRRPGDTMQFTDGFTGRLGSYLRWKHWDGVLNGAFLDGHAQRVSTAQWDEVDRDTGGYFYRISAADR